MVIKLLENTLNILYLYNCRNASKEILMLLWLHLFKGFKRRWFMHSLQFCYFVFEFGRFELTSLSCTLCRDASSGCNCPKVDLFVSDQMFINVA